MTTTLFGRLITPARLLRCWAGEAQAETLMRPAAAGLGGALLVRCWGTSAERLRELPAGSQVRVRGRLVAHPGEPVSLEVQELTRWPLLPGEAH